MNNTKPPKHMLIILISIITLSANAQNFQWVRNQTHSIQFNPDLTSFLSETDATGNSLLAGIFNYRLSFGNYYGDVSVRKYDPQGNLIFVKILYGKIIIGGMQTDKAGNIYLSGSFMDTLIIDTLNIILILNSQFSIHNS